MTALLAKSRFVIGALLLLTYGGLTQLAPLSGWWTAELGRQPWIVWQLLRTEDAFSPNVTTAQVAASLAMFAVLYAIVFGVFLVLLNRLIQAGPPDPPDRPAAR